MKFALPLLFALLVPCICFALPNPSSRCSGICPMYIVPVCVAQGGTHVLFENPCELKYFECLKGRATNEVSMKLCEGHSNREGSELISAILQISDSSSSSDSSD